jgi:hypothetical protein
LKRYFHDFENVRKELYEALESDKGIADLAEKLAARMPELRGRAALETWLLGEEAWFTGETWPRIDDVRLNGLIEQTPEQKEIGRFGQQLRDADRKIQDLRVGVQPLWAWLAVRDPAAKIALEEFDGLSPGSTVLNVDAIIELLEKVLHLQELTRRHLDEFLEHEGGAA